MNKLIFVALLFGLLGCSKGGGGGEDPTPEPVPIHLDLGIATRATDAGFESGDRIGLYVVNYNGTTPGVLQNSGNQTDNMKFTYSTTWTPDQTIYWKDETTRADFYCYYPYTAKPQIPDYSFEVMADQTTAAAYKASDFLWGKTTGVAPTSNAVKITMNHVFSCIRIKLEPGDGFTAESLEESDVKVNINHIRTQAVIQLATGKLTVTGEEQTVQPWKNAGEYRAIIVPQTVGESDLIVVNANGKDYTLTQGITFESGKIHTFTVTVNKTSNGINIGIGKWEDDGTDHGGIAE